MPKHGLRVTSMRSTILPGIILLLLSGMVAGVPGGASGSCLRFVDVKSVLLPIPIVTPSGHDTQMIYIDDRPDGDVFGLPIRNGVVHGDGTWVYFETNGQAGLQRGGVSDLPGILGLDFDESCIGQSTISDELLF
ncbi:MAG: hypothetical protein LC624_08835 [Halobacteriales archaeon]|nr:hypothetical protein [Halobacteriales archaeon]